MKIPLQTTALPPAPPWMLVQVPLNCCMVSQISVFIWRSAGVKQIETCWNIKRKFTRLWQPSVAVDIDMNRLACDKRGQSMKVTVKQSICGMIVRIVEASNAHTQGRSTLSEDILACDCVNTCHHKPRTSSKAHNNQAGNPQNNMFEECVLVSFSSMVAAWCFYGMRVHIHYRNWWLVTFLPSSSHGHAWEYERTSNWRTCWKTKNTYPYNRPLLPHRNSVLTGIGFQAGHVPLPKRRKNFGEWQKDATPYFRVLLRITETCTKYFPLLLRITKLAQSTSQYDFVLQSLHKVLPSTTSYYNACTKYFPVLLRTTKLAQSTSQYYTSYYKACAKYFPVLLRTTKLAQNTSQYFFVLQSLHNALEKSLPMAVLLRSTKLAQIIPSTTSYCKACTKYFPVRLRTTKLAQSSLQYYFVLQSLHKILPNTTSYLKACTKYFPVLLRTTKLAQSTSQYDFVLQSLHKVLPSTTSYYKACTKYFSVLLRITKLAQSTSQYDFVLQSLHKVLPSTTSYYNACTKYFPVLYVVLQSLHKALPSTTSYYKACAKYFPVLLRTTKLAQSTSQYYTSYYKACTKYLPVRLRTTKLAQSTSQYYFVLQSLHKVLPSTTSYYKACTKYFSILLPTTKACTKYFPVLLCTTKLAQSTSQYDFVLQSLHKVLPSTTSYYKACAKYFPVLLRTTKLAQSTSQYYTSYYKACTKYFPVLLRTTTRWGPHVISWVICGSYEVITWVSEVITWVKYVNFLWIYNFR